jgi:SAM-dependent methyltransferase
MNSPGSHGAKALRYARYRWDYAPKAVRIILDTAEVSARSVVADIGAGTGILTKHFVEKAGTVYAVEPDAKMAAFAVRDLSRHASFQIIHGYAEDTRLPDNSVDLIVSGQALHWFDPLPARREFLRILKPGGWLAVMWNRLADKSFRRDMKMLCSYRNGWGANMLTSMEFASAMSVYYGGRDFEHFSIAWTLEEDWERFLGGLCSNSQAPDESHPLYWKFIDAAKRVFEKSARGGNIRIKVATVLYVGRLIAARRGTE